MAFLLLLHEKLRLQRKINKLTLRQLRASNSKERITKNISRVQKMYASRQTALQAQAKMMQSQATVAFQNMYGLGVNSFNPMNFTGMNGFVMNFIGSALLNNGQGIQLGDKQIPAFSQDQINGMMNDYMTTGGTFKDKDGKFVNGYTEDQVNAFLYAMRQGQMMQQQAQMMSQQMSQQYQSNISIWLQAQEAALEEEQDAALAPLEMQETEMDLERESCEAQLADARARLESIKQACSEGIKDSAPTFGLG